jgi:predicted transcriptional regulator
MAKRKVSQISLDGIDHDEIDQKAALALTVVGEESTQGMITIAINELWRLVSEMYTNLRVSRSEINRRLERWAKRRWIEIEENTLTLTEQGKAYVKLLAEGAAA